MERHSELTTQDSAMMDIAAVDMTLLLGAESFVRHRQPGGQAIPQDPVGRECLTNLVDLLVNSEACFLLLPASDDYSVAPVLAQRTSALRRLHNCAAVTLKQTTERRIVREFKRVMEDYDWLAQWFRAHWGDPQVPRHHSLAFGNLTKRFATVTEEGWAQWQQHFASPAARTPLSLAMPDESYLASDVVSAGDLATYQYAYAYD